MVGKKATKNRKRKIDEESERIRWMHLFSTYIH